jgi:predicted dehydrogenase
VGVIGLGKLGLLHAGVANGLACARVVAAADTSDVLLRALQDGRPDLAAYADYRELLERERPDAVFIASPTHLHVPMALDCVARRVPFLVEKPLSVSAEAARPLLEALRQNPVVNMVGYMGRQVDTFRKAKQLIQAELLEGLQHLRASMYVSQLFQPGKGWRYDREKSGGGVLRTQNSHLIDTLHWYFGRVAGVSGQVKTLYSGTVDDAAHAWLEFESGLSGFIDTSWSIRHYRLPAISIDVHGRNGTLTVSDDEVRLFLDAPRGEHAAGWSVWRKPDLFRPVELDVGGPQYTLQDAEFLEAVVAGRAAECDVAAAYHCEQIIDAIYASAEAGGRRVGVDG